VTGSATDALPQDWAAALRAQGAPEAEIEQARALARRQAEAALGAAHDPLGAADPAAFLAVLREAGL
jgi:hypothetical protein